jgi:electron transport complex protein RnfC
MKVYSFPRGGLSFDDPTVPPRNYSVAAFLPALSVIPLVQHPGGRAAAMVSVGDMVKEGMLIGRGKSPGPANVHATVPGKVVRNVEWQDSEGRLNEGFVIRMEGSFERLGKKEEKFPHDGIDHHELQRILTDCGIVEMEGSGRPVTEILSGFRGAGKPQTLVVRCVFDDPWLAADYVLCKERLQAAVEGAFIVAKSSGRINRVVFAVSGQERDIGETMLSEAALYDIQSSLVLTGSKYPQRNYRELELVLRNYGKKENVNLGALLVLGPATLAAVHDAVKYRRPILERYVAVGGSAVVRPQVMRVRIGKRIGDLFEECGGFTGHPFRIAVGSPFSGRTVRNLDEPVTKNSYAVFAMLKSQVGHHAERDCICCGECRRVCPVGLDPEELYKRIITMNRDEPRPAGGAPSGGAPSGAEECHGCGCCELVCPSSLPLSDMIMGKIRGNGNG